MKTIKNIFDKMKIEYSKMDDAHNFTHIENVIENAKILNNLLGNPYSDNIIIISALYHDIGNIVNRKDHHIESARIVLEDKDLKELFNDDELYLISKACEEHRSSYKGEFTSTLSKIINDADSMVYNIEDIIERCYKYTISKYSTESERSIYYRVYDHIVDKFGRNGYQKYKLSVTNKIANVENIYSIIEDEYKFKYDYYYEVVERIKNNKE